MPTIQKVLRLSKNQYYETHLLLVNALLPAKMTPKEVEVMARFMALEGDIATDRFGTSARKIIKEELDISDGGLGNYLKSLKNKNFLRLNPQGKLEIHPLLQNSPTEQIYAFRLENTGVL